MKEFTKLSEADLLPASWDQLGSNYFQSRRFLLHTSRYNPCQQRYYMHTKENTLVAAAVVYTLELDLLTFLHVRSPLKMHIIGIPCSVSAAGIFGEKQSIESLKAYIIQVEKGLVLFLNLEEEPVNGNYAIGKTLPTIAWINENKTWEDYEKSLRSPYRRRLKTLMEPLPGLKFDYIPFTAFSSEYYQMYLEVWKKSKGKLEKLTLEFFRNLPSEFKLLVCSLQGKAIGWNIALQDVDTCYFFLGGIDYSHNKTVKTYLRLLARLVREGIENKVLYIDLGQTAETPKMRMGGKPVALYMQAHHSNMFFNWLLKRLSFLLDYKMKANFANPIKKLES